MRKLTPLEQAILQAVALGGRRIHDSYLPEVLALVCQGKLHLVDARPGHLRVERAA